MGSELIRTWENDGFRLELYDTGEVDGYGKWVLAYRLFDNGNLVFEGHDFHCPPLYAVDSDWTVSGLLAFLSLRPGDTDSEYFDGYSPEQLGWVESGRAEELGYLQAELEEAGTGLFDSHPSSADRLLRRS